jgi:putative ABC transport system substrate-binding protein
MTSRRQLLALIGATLAGGLPAGRATAANAPLRIGYLTTGTAESNAAFLVAFRDALRERGLVEGKNVEIELRFAGSNAGRFPELAASLVKSGADLMIGTCIPSTRAARDATTSLPIVMAIDGDPVRAGLVESLARPGGNVTGMSTAFEALIPKWLELLHLAAPDARNVAVLSNPDNVIHPYYSARFDEAAQRIGVRTTNIPLQVKAEIDGAFAQMRQRGVDALVVMTEAGVAGNEARIVPLAARYRLPAIYGFREFADAGGLMSYGISYHDYFRNVARYVDAVLRGAKPADLPVEQPSRIELVLNLRTAKALGLDLPQPLLLRADALIR